MKAPLSQPFQIGVSQRESWGFGLPAVASRWHCCGAPTISGQQFRRAAFGFIKPRGKISSMAEKEKRTPGRPEREGGLDYRTVGAKVPEDLAQLVKGPVGSPGSRRSRREL